NVEIGNVGGDGSVNGVGGRGLCQVDFDQGLTKPHAVGVHIIEARDNRGTVRVEHLVRFHGSGSVDQVVELFVHPDDHALPDTDARGRGTHGGTGQNMAVDDQGDYTHNQKILSTRLSLLIQ